MAATQPELHAVLSALALVRTERRPTNQQSR